MFRVIAIGGEPATGKTTLMFELIKKATDWEIVKPEKLLDAMYSKSLNTYILGKYANDGNVFQGTDRLSMAVQPDAEKFFASQFDKSVNVIFEGDRLFNGKTINMLSDKLPESQFKVLVLEATHGTKEKRHHDRKDDQDDKFKNSRATKIANICSSLTLMDYITIMTNENLDDQKKIIGFINDFLQWSE